MQLLPTLLSALALAASTTAKPIRAAKRADLIVVSPNITSPTEGTVWPVGTNQTVTWNTANIPPSGQNNTGEILLGHDDGSGSENLNYTNPLAYGFLLTAGSQQVTVPDVVPGDAYFIVLLGDSGNRSPNITIAN